MTVENPFKINFKKKKLKFSKLTQLLFKRFDLNLVN